MSALGSIALLLLVSCLQTSFATDSDVKVGGSSSSQSASMMKRSVFYENKRSNPRLRVSRSAMAYPPLWGPLNYRFGDSSVYVKYAALPFEKEGGSWSSISDQKREGGLIPFPRVGRSGNGPKRNGAGTSGSLWFGPRLGKREFETSSKDTMEEFEQNKIALEDFAK